MKYILNSEVFDNIEDLLFEIGQYDLIDVEESFKEIIDEEGDIEILGLFFSRYEILKVLDPIGYRCELENFKSDIIDNCLSYEIEKLRPYDTFTGYGIEIECIDDEEDDDENDE